jgi:hypothetical protein
MRNINLLSIWAQSTVKEETGFSEDVLNEVVKRNFSHINPRNGYMVYKYIHIFKRIFYDTAKEMARCVNELDYMIRLSPFNHVVHFPTRVTGCLYTA